MKHKFPIALAQRENIGRLLDPPLLVEKGDLLFAETVDIESAARYEVFKVAERLIWAGEFSGAAGTRSLRAARNGLAHNVRMQRARTLRGEFIRLGVTQPLFQDHVKNLRNNIAGALDGNGIAFANIQTLYLLLVVQGRVLHHDAADGDRLELGDRGERAGAADLDLDVLDHGRRLLGREFVRDRPARVARYEAEPLLPVDAVDLVDDAVDVVVERRALRLDLTVKLQQRLERMATVASGLVLKPHEANHLTMPDCVSAGIALISPQE